MSGSGAARITACGRVRWSAHKSTVPASVVAGTAGPVVNTIVVPVLVALRRRSTIPGNSWRWYTRPRCHPSRGDTWIELRCQETLTSLPTGERMTFWASPLIVPGAPPRDGISSITSSNWTTASPRRSGATLPDSGTVRRTVGGVVRGGPPGGSPWLAQAPPPTRTVRSSRAT